MAAERSAGMVADLGRFQPLSLSHRPQLEFTAGTDSAACSTLTISGDQLRLASPRVSRVQQRLRVRRLRHIFGFANPPREERRPYCGSD